MPVSKEKCLELSYGKSKSRLAVAGKSSRNGDCSRETSWCRMVFRHKTKGSAVFGKYNQSFSLTGSECNRLITTLGGFDCEGMAGFTRSEERRVGKECRS